VIVRAEKTKHASKEKVLWVGDIGKNENATMKRTSLG